MKRRLKAKEWSMASYSGPGHGSITNAGLRQSMPGFNFGSCYAGDASSQGAQLDEITISRLILH